MVVFVLRSDSSSAARGPNYHIKKVFKRGPGRQYWVRNKKIVRLEDESRIPKRLLQAFRGEEAARQAAGVMDEEDPAAPPDLEEQEGEAEQEATDEKRPDPRRRLSFSSRDVIHPARDDASGDEQDEKAVQAKSGLSPDLSISATGSTAAASSSSSSSSSASSFAAASSAILLNTRTKSNPPNATPSFAAPRAQQGAKQADSTERDARIARQLQQQLAPQLELQVALLREFPLRASCGHACNTHTGHIPFCNNGPCGELGCSEIKQWHHPQCRLLTPEPAEDADDTDAVVAAHLAAEESRRTSREEKETKTRQSASPATTTLRKALEIATAQREREAKRRVEHQLESRAKEKVFRIREALVKQQKSAIEIRYRASADGAPCLLSCSLEEGHDEYCPHGPCKITFLRKKKFLCLGQRCLSVCRPHCTSVTGPSAELINNHIHLHV